MRISDWSSDVCSSDLFADLRGRRFVLDDRTRVAAFGIRKGMRATAIADQQAVALCVVACAFRSLADTNEAAISLWAMTGGDALGANRRLRVAAEMNHLGAGAFGRVSCRERVCKYR